MNASLAPIPAEREPIQSDGVKWFIGYMPVSTEVGGGTEEAHPLPPMPDFSVSPSWAATTDLAFAVNPFARGGGSMGWASRDECGELPCEVGDVGECYTDEDLQEVLAELMVSEADVESVGPVASGEIAPMLRSAARRAVAEIVESRMKPDRAMSFERVCDGIKRMVGRLVFSRSESAGIMVREVVGLLLFRKGSFDVMVSAGQISVEVEDHIVRVLRQTADHSEEPVYMRAHMQVHFVRGERHVLVAVICGEPDDAMVEDLAYLLRRVEARIDKCSATDHESAAGIRFLLLEGLLIRCPVATDNARYGNSV